MTSSTRVRRWRYAVLVAPLAMGACSLLNDASDLLPRGDAGLDALSSGDGNALDGEGAPKDFCTGPLVPANNGDAAAAAPDGDRWCDTLPAQQHAFFCSDFDALDGGSWQAQGWYGLTHTDNGGAITLVDSGALTSPNAASVVIVPPWDAAFQEGSLSQSFAFPAGLQDACVEFDYYADALTDSTQVVSFALDDGTTLGLVFGSPLAAVYDGTPDAGAGFLSLDVGAGLPIKSWTRVRFHLHLPDGGPPEVQASYGGQLPPPVPIAPLGQIRTVTLGVGGVFVQNTGDLGATFTARFDDVVFSAR